MKHVTKFTKVNSMRYVLKIEIMLLAVAVVASAVSSACASAPRRIDASTPGIHTIDEVGIAKVPKASLHLQLAKRQMKIAEWMAANELKNRQSDWQGDKTETKTNEAEAANL